MDTSGQRKEKRKGKERQEREVADSLLAYCREVGYYCNKLRASSRCLYYSMLRHCQMDANIILGLPSFLPSLSIIVILHVILHKTRQDEMRPVCGMMFHLFVLYGN